MGNDVSACECKDWRRCALRNSLPHVCRRADDHDRIECYTIGPTGGTIHRCKEPGCGKHIDTYYIGNTFHVSSVQDREGMYCALHAKMARRCQMCRMPRTTIREDDGICYGCRKGYCASCGKNDGDARPTRRVLCDDCVMPCAGNCGWTMGANGHVKRTCRDPPPCPHHGVQNCSGMEINSDSADLRAGMTQISRCYEITAYSQEVALCDRCQREKPKRLAIIDCLQKCDALNAPNS